MQKIKDILIKIISIEIIIAIILWVTYLIKLLITKLI